MIKSEAVVVTKCKRCGITVVLEGEKECFTEDVTTYGDIMLRMMKNQWDTREVPLVHKCPTRGCFGVLEFVGVDIHIMD